MYNKLKLKKIEFENQNINSKQIMKGLFNCYKKYAFSTFPYMYEELSSNNGLNKYNSGNCISLSISLKNYLKENHNIKSYLIPATIPKKYSQSGYLEISHVSLLIPKNKKTCYIADPAFYFINPIKSNVDKKKGISTVYSKRIYNKENNKEPKDYTSLEKIVYEEKELPEDLYLNKYQIIPKSTKYSIVNNTDDILDKWKYYLIEVLNPDEAISNFFINVLKRPFILTTKMDNNGICCMDVYLKMINKNNNINLEITCNDKLQLINLENISENELRNRLSIYEKKLDKYFNGKLIDVLLNCKNKLKNKSVYKIED